MKTLASAGGFTQPAAHESWPWVEQFRSNALSIGTYRLPAGGSDPQQPHTEDEVYVVTSGRARLVADTGEVDVGPGSVIYVPAGEAHRFIDITEGLAVLVIFAPPEYSNAPPSA